MWLLVWGVSIHAVRDGLTHSEELHVVGRDIDGSPQTTLIVFRGGQVWIGRPRHEMTFGNCLPSRGGLIIKLDNFFISPVWESFWTRNLGGCGRAGQSTSPLGEVSQLEPGPGHPPQGSSRR